MKGSWADWRRHVDQVVADRGKWVGILNGSGEPELDMPPSLEPYSGEHVRMSPEAGFRQTVATTLDNGATSQIVDLLVDEGLGVFSETGVIAPSTDRTFMVCVAVPGRRRAWLLPERAVTFGELAPERLEVEGVSMLSLLERWPCPSAPDTWKPNLTTWPEDAGGRYTTPRRYGPVELATRADGYTKRGPAELVITELIQESLDAVNRAMGWSARPHLVVDAKPSGRPSDVVNIRVEDDSVWETVSGPAAVAGVDIDVDLWWPGDAPVTVLERGKPVSRSWSFPVGVVRVNRTGGAV